LVYLDTHTYQKQLKPAFIKFFARLDLKIINLGILRKASQNKQMLPSKNSKEFRNA